MRYISTRKWFLVFHKWYHFNVEPKLGKVHTKFIFPLFIKLGGVAFHPDKEN